MTQATHWLSIFTCWMTLTLLCAGAFVTSTGSGLAVPDWPLSFGQFFPPMVGGVLYEHGHRLIAALVGCLTLVLCLALLKWERRLWVRWLGAFALLAVLFQALLGGMTVLLRLPIAVSVIHACLAQIFFSLTVILAMVTSPTWAKTEGGKEELAPLRTHFLAVSVFFFLQLLLGAIMRHLGAGLAIPDFPLAFGQIFPELTSFGIAVHYAHRMGALVISIAVIILATRVYVTHFGRIDLVGGVGALITLILVQILLGAMTIWLRRPVILTVFHLATGALCLATSVALTFRVFWLSRFVGVIPARGSHFPMCKSSLEVPV